ncbi:MAG TPA: type II secretion system F family protein [Ignavibacteriaceae bacterium]|nr:type II secretion system F family protein [Ignavibacteriaceae bacterium]
MIELKFTAEKLDGQFVGGIIAADTISSAKHKANLIAVENNFKIKTFQRKSTYTYKVRRGKEKPLTGEQKAFDRQEVVEALTLLGYDIVSVNKKLFENPSKPKLTDILNFVKISADMLEEKMAFGEILSFVIADTRNKLLKETLREISKDLKQGVDSEQAFMKHKNVLGYFTAFMLGLASKSGNMTEIYRAAAKFLERRYEFKKNLKSALITPLATVLVLNAAVIWYVTYIFPETAKLFLRFGMKLPPMTSFTLDLADFLASNMIFLILLVVVPIIAGVFIYRHPLGRVWFDKQLIKLPIIGEILHKTYIEIFCRVFYTLYSGSAVSVTPIRIGAEAMGNKYLEERIKNIALPIMTNKGVGISDALVATGVFPETAISKFRQGEETGNIKKSALQLANYYESDTVYRLKNFIEWVQIGIAFYVLIVMVLLTLVSAETAIISPTKPGVMDRTR